MPAPLEVTLPSDREIMVSRVFDAPAQLVFDCHTVPALVQRWLLGPPGWTMPICEIDLRVGGAYRYRWRSDGGDAEFGTQGEFREIVSPTRIVHTERMDGAEGEAICTSRFEERGGKTHYSMTMLFPTREIRDMAHASGMSEGMGSSYDRLEQVMETLDVA